MKILKLNNINKDYFGYDEIARVLGITLASARVSANRYVRNGILIRLKRDMYVIKERWKYFTREQKFEMANLLQVPSYISLLSALDFYEITTQMQRDFTESVVLKRTKVVSIGDTIFNYTKMNTLLFEFRSKDYPRKLKIEIRKILKRWDCQEKIAYSKFSTKQVIVKTHTLEQTMTNKIEAILERKEIRDGFDIEFILRRGINLPQLSPKNQSRLRKIIEEFSANDFKVTLGSVLESEMREYYIENRFSALLERLSQNKHNISKSY